MPTKPFSPLKTKSFARLKLDLQHNAADTLTIIAWNPDETSLEAGGLNEQPQNSTYTAIIFSPEIFVEVRRRSDNKTLLSTARGPLIASDGYFEWSFYLNSAELMGFDELHLSEGQRILINNEYSSVVPYVLAFGKLSEHTAGLPILCVHLNRNVYNGMHSIECEHVKRFDCFMSQSRLSNRHDRISKKKFNLYLKTSKIS